MVQNKENNSNTFITKLKRFIDGLYFRKIINTYQQPMLNRIHLFCGLDKIKDPKQLPPIILGKDFFIRNADISLTEIFRSSSDSSLLKVATDIQRIGNKKLWKNNN